MPKGVVGSVVQISTGQPGALGDAEESGYGVHDARPIPGTRLTLYPLRSSPLANAPVARAIQGILSLLGRCHSPPASGILRI